MSVIADRLLEFEPKPALADGGEELPQLRAQHLSGPDWDGVIGGFDEVCQEQMYAFATAHWPGVACEPIVFHLDGQIVGGVLVMVQPLPLAVAHMAVLKWAPMLADAARDDGDAVRAAMVEMVLAEYSRTRRMMVSILLPASVAPTNPAYATLRERGFQRGPSLRFPNRYLVRVKLSDAEQRKSLHQKWRYHLNKAEKAGLMFERGSPADLGQFKALYEAMSDRKQFPDHSAYETIDALMTMDDPLRPELFFVRQDDDLLAGALIFKAGKRAVYLYGATNDRALPARAGYFMHWHIIGWLRDHTQTEWYDLGGTDGFLGLHQFKKGMVGEAGVIREVPPVINYADSRWAYLMGTGAYRVRDWLQYLRFHLLRWRSSKARPDQKPHVPENYLR